ncbi:uncharacterized protein LOC125029431 [Penaeus chinensis]|uniref:uncharacterized protein LOC125029431 n=1 Tax=Penaeus chinensis TaxID=139456 RepID=UPI001FB832D2|nr:uncharacterized protein LOC125029431 [Penaeus chinensis]
MWWLERAYDLCCWCPCHLHKKRQGVAMPRGSRAQAASPVRLHYDLATTPLFQDHDDSGDIVLYDTSVEYLPSHTKTRTSIVSDTGRMESLREQLLAAGEELSSPLGGYTDDSGEDANPSLVPAQNYYEKTVELESPGARGSMSSLSSSEYVMVDRVERDSAMISVFRALRCVDGVEAAERDRRFSPLEVQRPRRPAHGRSHPNYRPVRQTTIDY